MPIKFFMLISTLLLIGFCQQAFADECDSAVEQATLQIDTIYLPKIDLWTKISYALQNKGLDPHKYPVIMPDGSVEILDIPDVISKLAIQRANGYNQIQQAVADCKDAIAPYQKITDVSAFIVTGGLSAVLPPQMTHVDAAQLLGGHPIGGAGALIPSTRDAVLKSLGISGDVAGIIKDPLCVIHGGCS
ncbi:hypothetical protein [Acidisoma silvae]|uniref:Uncharacterized protein n=1 Tax=Acidisoma silvae TaxID=2802396 RepID=A0A964E1B4_9PROT|nr:hypothetical protein [Acidisoma silvae]MCB8878400.1 hypothetical protein [Acidisoma silvae]